MGFKDELKREMEDRANTEIVFKNDIKEAAAKPLSDEDIKALSERIYNKIKSEIKGKAINKKVDVYKQKSGLFKPVTYKYSYSSSVEIECEYNISDLCSVLVRSRMRSKSDPLTYTSSHFALYQVYEKYYAICRNEQHLNQLGDAITILGEEDGVSVSYRCTTRTHSTIDRKPITVPLFRITGSLPCNKNGDVI